MIDPKVVVNDPVSKPDYPRPFNLIIFGFELFGQSIRCLANNFKVADYCVYCLVIVDELVLIPFVNL
jgi:hypothetical protein